MNEVTVKPTEGNVKKINSYQKENKEYVRVTSILSLLPSPGLDWWKKEKTAQAAILAMKRGLTENDALKLAMNGADDASKAARESGTLVHEILQKINKGESVDLSKIEDQVVKRKILAWVEFKHKNGIKTLSAERTVFSERYNVAGTLDLYGEMGGGLRFIGDYKPKIYDKVFIQLAAYNEFLKENKVIDKDVALMAFELTEDGVEVHTTDSFFAKGGRNKGQETHIPTQEELFSVFRSLHFIWRFQNIKVGKWEPLVKDFGDLSKDTMALLTAQEEQWKK